MVYTNTRFLAAGGLIEAFSDLDEHLDIGDVLNKKGVFALM